MSSEVSAQYDKIYKYCYFKTGDAVLAEDITQETFLRFYKAGKYHERGKVMAYLYTIAANLIKDSYRNKKTFPPAEPLDENIQMCIRDSLKAYAPQLIKAVYAHQLTARQFSFSHLYEHIASSGYYDSLGMFGEQLYRIFHRLRLI